jgi:hypothetical protein
MLARVAGTSAQLHELARLVDCTHRGHINIWQFCQAFVTVAAAVDSGAGRERGGGGVGLRRQISHAVVQAVAGAIFSNRGVLRRVFWDYDEDLEEFVTVRVCHSCNSLSTVNCSACSVLLLVS